MVNPWSTALNESMKLGFIPVVHEELARSSDLPKFQAAMSPSQPFP